MISDWQEDSCRRERARRASEAGITPQLGEDPTFTGMSRSKTEVFSLGFSRGMAMAMSGALMQALQKSIITQIQILEETGSWRAREKAKVNGKGEKTGRKGEKTGRIMLVLLYTSKNKKEIIFSIRAKIIDTLSNNEDKAALSGLSFMGPGPWDPAHEFQKRKEFVLVHKGRLHQVDVLQRGEELAL